MLGPTEGDRPRVAALPNRVSTAHNNRPFTLSLSSDRYLLMGDARAFGPISRPRSPVPTATSSSARAVMIGNRGADTRPEREVRSLLFAAGVRFRKHVRPLDTLRCTADIVFSRERIAVFIDGCFWHSCPKHGRQPRSHAVYWREKLEHNAQRDRRNSIALQQAGWLVLRYWEHEPPREIVADVQRHVEDRRKASS